MGLLVQDRLLMAARKTDRQFSGPLFDSDHRCPSWCHTCPDMVAIAVFNGEDESDSLNTTMPMCMGGSLYGLDGCHCSSEDRKSTATFTARVRLLTELVTAYPSLARHIVAKHAPPKQTDKPRLRVVAGPGAGEG